MAQASKLKWLNVDMLAQNDAIAREEIHVYKPYTDAYGYNDSIRISIQNNDGYTVPGDSFIVIEGKAVKTAAQTEATPSRFVTNAFAHLFADMRLEVNNIEVDRVRQPGITTTLKGIASFTSEERETMGYAAWPRSDDETTIAHLINGTTGTFSARIPLKTLFGFAEDHRDIVTGVKQDLVLTRASHDNDALLTTEAAGNETESTVVITKIEWHVPRLRLHPQFHVRIQQLLLDGVPLPVDFMAWDLFTYPNLPPTQSLEWQVKTSSPMESPQYIFLAFQTKRSNALRANASEFDHITLSSAKAVVNDVEYPYHDLTINVTSGRIADIFDMFRAFYTSYYKTAEGAASVGRKAFQSKYPMVLFDCTKHDSPALGKTVDTRIRITTRANIPPNTTAYALILHRRSFDYVPVKATVNKLNA